MAVDHPHGSNPSGGVEAFWCFLRHIAVALIIYGYIVPNPSGRMKDSQVVLTRRNRHGNVVKNLDDDKLSELFLKLTGPWLVCREI